MRQFKGHSAPHNYIGDAHCNQHHGDDGALELFNFESNFEQFYVEFDTEFDTSCVSADCAVS